MTNEKYIVFSSGHNNNDAGETCLSLMRGVYLCITGRQPAIGRVVVFPALLVFFRGISGFTREGCAAIHFTAHTCIRTLVYICVCVWVKNTHTHTRTTTAEGRVYDASRVKDGNVVSHRTRCRQPAGLRARINRERANARACRRDLPRETARETACT